MLSPLAITPNKNRLPKIMILLSLIIYLSCATTSAVLAAGAPPTPDPKTTVVFTCADSKDQPNGWCVARKKPKPPYEYGFVEANVVGPAKDFNYNCIGKTYADNNVCCKSTFKPNPNGRTTFTSDDCQIKNFKSIMLIFHP
ncbi:hypothetical protein H4Q26_017057 [Puccinia striiformis f. sp. tritici PST-130]|nr:hypothetical protein H4Q26_017057 [Puccinia striiformis f. sp. tritici PST-130]